MDQQSETQSHPPSSGPLKGIKIVDFCSAVAGAYSAAMLGDMGADVIKVEALEGDQSRQWGPFYAGEGQLFETWNRNKRSLALNLRSEAGQEIARKLASSADVVIENYRPGVAEKLRIDFESIRALNPRVIYCSTTAFGPRGPWRNRPAYDPILQAMSGIAAGNQTYSGVVAICSVAAVDYSTAFLVLSGILAALYHRAVTGEGQKVETSLLQGALAIQSHAYFQPLKTPPSGAIGIFPNHLFRTKEGFIHISAPTNKFWGILCQTLGAPELAAGGDYSTNEKRCARMEELKERLHAILAHKTAREWETIFLSKDIPCGVVQSYQEFLNLPQVEAMGMNPVIEHPTIGPVRVGGVPIHFDKTPGAITRPAPCLGQHTREILRELGFSEEQIEEMIKNEIIRCGTT